MNSIEFRNAKNAMEFIVEGAAYPFYAAATEDKFVLLRTPDLGELRELLTSFREGFIGGIREYFRSVPSELELGASRFRTDRPVVIGLSGAAYVDKWGRSHYRFEHFRKGVVSEGMKVLGLDRKYPLRETESPSACPIRMDVGDQVRLVDWLTDRPLHAWGSASPKEEFMLWLAPNLEVDLTSANDPHSFLECVAEQCLELLVRGTRQAKDENRPIGYYWFAKHLHQAGIWLFPLGVWSRLVQQGIPKPLKGLARTCLVHDQAAPVFDDWLEWMKAHSRATERTQDGYIRTFRYIDHTSTFCPALPICSDLFAYYQSIYEKVANDLDTKKGGREHNFVGLRMLFKFLHHHHGVELAEDALSRKLAGASRKLNRTAWAWVDDPNVTLRPGLYERAVGQPEPETHPEFLAAWAERLRELLPRLGVKNLEFPISRSQEWLLYLCKLNAMGRPVPKDFQSIVRSKHINAGDNPSHYTFINFLKERAIATDSKNQAITNLHHMWIHDATLRGVGVEGCPILKKFDRIKGVRGAGKHWRTVRDAMEPEIWQIIIEENRRNDFEFSRSRLTPTGKLVDHRAVKDPISGRATRVWFPGTAVLVDLLLSIPFRKANARFLDSGEGDEKLLDIVTLEYHPNPLPTATKGRQQGFFRRSKLGLRKDQVALGMYINTNKTGPDFEVPWLERDLAETINSTIEWQKTYNPISKPVPAADISSVDVQYGDLDLHGDTYPIFRDPATPENRPISEMQVYGYYRDLLEHVEPILSERLGFEVSLFEENEDDASDERGAPVFDLHSLRVTGVTTLLAHGVPIEVVQRLVGHASKEMTWYYNAISNSRIHAELQKGMEARKLTGKDLRNMTEVTLERLKANVFNTRNEDDFAAFSMLKRQILGRTPHWELLPHGICPGGRCEEGGSKTKTGYEALHRERACSLCRFRITGPMFLQGLVHHQNVLMWEIKQSLRRSAKFIEQANQVEDDGRDPTPYLAQRNREQQLCDQLYEEWFAEYVYVRRAEGMLEDWLAAGKEPDVAGGRSLPTLFGQADPAAIKIDLADVHELRMLHNLIRDAEIIGGIQLPRGVAEDRNEMLLRIARANNIEDFFYRLERTKMMAALTMFGDVILDSTEGDTDEIDRIDGLVSGRSRLQDLPALEVRVEQMLKTFGQGATRIVPRGNETLLTAALGE